MVLVNDLKLPALEPVTCRLKLPIRAIGAATIAASFVSSEKKARQNAICCVGIMLPGRVIRHQG